ncbi:MAG: hypothetical protein FJ149_06685 [Euryarchaeota archaeon]|nr:hypothetical protein [Euryarchaeota archaeon]
MPGLASDVIRGLREFPPNMRDLLTAPKTLIIFLAGLGFIIYFSTNPLMASIFPWVVLFLGYLAYNIHLYKKDGYILDWKRKGALAMVCSIMVVTSVYGYEILYVNDIDLARVPRDILDKNDWSRFPEQDSSELLSGYLLRVEVRAFRYDYNNPQAPPYPGALWLATIKTVFVPGQDVIQGRVEDQIRSFKMEGLAINEDSRTSGSDTLRNGHSARFFEWDAILAGTGSGFFREVSLGAKIKIRAEWWACEEHGTAVVAIGAAQWGVVEQTDGLGHRLPGPPDNFDTVESIKRIIYYVECA